MKLLVISAAYPPQQSGEAANAFFLCQKLADRGVDIHVLTTRGSIPHAHPRIKIHPVMKSWSWSELPRMKRVLKASAPDAVLLIYLGWVFHYEPMVTYAPTIAKKFLPHVPFVTRFENVTGADPRQTSFLSRVIRKLMSIKAGPGAEYAYGTLLRDSDRIIVLSEAHRHALSEVRPDVQSKSVLIPPPANMQMSKRSLESARAYGRDRLHLDDDKFVITYIGYIYPSKGIESLLRAFARVSSQRSNARLVLMGGAIAPEFGNPVTYLQTLSSLAESLGVADKVTWTGPYSWDDENTSAFLHASDVCVLPFRAGIHLNNSSFASVASHSLPVITTRGEFLEEQFLHAKNVYLCPPESPQALAEAITTVMDDPELRRTLSAGINKLSHAWFSWESALDRTTSACNLVLPDSHGNEEPAASAGAAILQPATDTNHLPTHRPRYAS